MALKRKAWPDEITTPPKNYIPATDSTIMGYLDNNRYRRGMVRNPKSISPALVRDIANIFAGGNIRPSYIGTGEANFVEGGRGFVDPERTIRSLVELAIDAIDMFEDHARSGKQGPKKSCPNCPSNVASLFDNVDHIMGLTRESQVDEIDADLLLKNRKILDESRVLHKSRIDLAEKAVWDKMDRIMNRFTPLKVSKEIRMEPDFEGTERRLRLMRTPSDLVRARATEFILPAPIVAARVLTGATLVKERVAPKIRKRLTYLMVDTSGSMAGARAIMATGLMYSRIKSAYRGDSELYIAFYEEEVYHTIGPINDAKTAREATDYVLGAVQYDGGTNTGNSIVMAVDHVKKVYEANAGDVYRPEIVVIGDATDEVDTKIDTGGVIVNSITLYPDDDYREAQNTIRKLTKNTGGHEVGIYERGIDA